MNYIEELEKQNEELRQKLAEAEYRIGVFEKQEADRLLAMQQAHESINKKIHVDVPPGGNGMNYKTSSFQFGGRYSQRIYRK